MKVAEQITILGLIIFTYGNAQLMVVSQNEVVFVKDNNTEKFYLKTGGSNMELIGHQMQDYIRQQFSLFLQIITFKHCIHQYAIEVSPAKQRDFLFKPTLLF